MVTIVMILTRCTAIILRYRSAMLIGFSKNHECVHSSLFFTLVIADYRRTSELLSSCRKVNIVLLCCPIISLPKVEMIGAMLNMVRTMAAARLKVEFLISMSVF